MLSTGKWIDETRENIRTAIFTQWDLINGQIYELMDNNVFEINETFKPIMTDY